MKRAVGIPLAILIIIGISYAPWTTHPFSPNPQPTVTIKKHTFHVTIAATASEQQKGLGGVIHLEPDQGMYFPLDPNQTPGFWMKGMLIPIDIIWIKDNKIASINSNVPAYPLDTPDNQLPVYQSVVSHPTAVLEIVANRSSQLGLQAGDPVVFSDK